MKIVHLIKTTTGATWALRQITELIKYGCDIHVVLPDSKNLYQKYIDAGATVHILNVDIAQGRRPLQLAKSLHAFRNLVDNIHPDMVHSHFVGTTLFMRIALKDHKVKRIFQVAGPLHLENPVTKNVEIRLADKYDYWIPTCQLSKDIYLKSGIEENKLMLTYYGTDISLYVPKIQGVLKTEFDIPKQKQIVGMVAYAYAPKKWLGQTRGIKGHEDLIDAMQIVCHDNPNVMCVIVGGAWVGASEYFETVKAYGKEKLGEKILFLDTRKDVPDLYPDFDIVVHPSHSENLGGAGESLLMGVPTIATNIGGFPDIVIPNETGWLVPVKNADSLANAIKEALSNTELAHIFATEGSKRVRNILDVEKTSKDVHDFYKKILES